MLTLVCLTQEQNGSSVEHGLPLQRSAIPHLNSETNPLPPIINAVSNYLRVS